MKLRKRHLWRLHSWLGLVAGLGLLVIGVTGSLLVFSDEIDGILRPGVVRASAEAPEARLPFDQLVAEAASAFPGHDVAGWELFPDEPAASDRVWLEERESSRVVSFRLDPYTGETLSDPAEASDHFTGWLLELHYTFLADHAGMLVAGILGVMLLVLGISGVWLYGDFWSNLFRLRWRRSARIFFSDVHKSIGISAVVFNLVLGFTGAWWNIAHLIGHLGEDESAETETVERPRDPHERASVAAMLERAPDRIGGYTARYIAFPDSGEAPLTFYGHHGDANPFRGIYGSTVSFDAESGEIVDHFDIREASVGRQIYDSFMPLHYGTFGGWPVKVLWCMGGLAPGALAVTGFVVWKSRRPSRKAREVA